MKKSVFILLATLFFFNAQAFTIRDTLKIKKTVDFELDGAGSNLQWD